MTESISVRPLPLVNFSKNLRSRIRRNSEPAVVIKSGPFVPGYRFCSCHLQGSSPGAGVQFLTKSAS